MLLEAFHGSSTEARANSIPPQLSSCLYLLLLYPKRSTRMGALPDSRPKKEKLKRNEWPHWVISGNYSANQINGSLRHYPSVTGSASQQTCSSARPCSRRVNFLAFVGIKIGRRSVSIQLSLAINSTNPSLQFRRRSPSSVTITPARKSSSNACVWVPLCPRLQPSNIIDRQYVRPFRVSRSY